MKFKLRAVASFNKLPGFPKFSGYKQMNLLGPGMLATQGQVAHILERMTETFPDFKDTRQLVGIAHKNRIPEEEACARP